MHGEWVFQLKDWIDRKWMHSYSGALPLMGLDTYDDVNYQELAAEFAREQKQREKSKKENTDEPRNVGAVTETG